MIIIEEGPHTKEALNNCYKYLMDLRKKHLLEEQKKRAAEGNS